MNDKTLEERLKILRVCKKLKANYKCNPQKIIDLISQAKLEVVEELELWEKRQLAEARKEYWPEHRRTILYNRRHRD